MKYPVYYSICHACNRCHILLKGGSGGIEYSSNITEMNEAIASHHVTIVATNLDPMLPYSCSASVIYSDNEQNYL